MSTAPVAPTAENQDTVVTTVAEALPVAEVAIDALLAAIGQPQDAAVVDALGALISKALAAYAAAAGTPVTVANIQALLLPNTPLVDPTK